MSRVKFTYVEKTFDKKNTKLKRKAVDFQMYLIKKLHH